MTKDRRGWTARGNDRSSHCQSLHPTSPPRLLFHLSLLLLFSNVNSVNSQGAFFRSLLGVPDHCPDQGVGLTTCSFLITCVLNGGSPVIPCGGGFLYTCCDKPVVTVRSDVSNDIAAFDFFRDASEFRPKLRTFGRNRSPPLRLNQFRFPLRHNLIPVSVRGESLSSPEYEYPPKHFLSSRDESHALTKLNEEQFFNEPECGIRQTKQFAKRIIGGDEAEFGELPWQAHIRISGYQCGGVLLNRLFVATAAHCVHKARLHQITIHLGEYDTKDTGKYYEPFPKETFAVVQKKTHPRFKYMLTQPDRFDVAVLRLSHPVNYKPNIVPICLPSPSDDFEGSVGIVAGWGKTDTSFGKTGTNILRKVMVPVINNRECLRWHHLKGIDVKLHYEMFCAGHSDGEMDACLGDSGGPLVIQHRGRWRLAGITSAGFGCAVDHQPGIYHKVSITAGWIADNIRP